MISVFLNDERLTWDTVRQYYQEAHEWAREICASYQGYHVQDVTDFSMHHDLIACYRFADEKEVVMFKLRWQ